MSMFCYREFGFVVFFIFENGKGLKIVEGFGDWLNRIGYVCFYALFLCVYGFAWVLLSTGDEDVMILRFFEVAIHW